jgi:hypothetical protein
VSNVENLEDGRAARRAGSRRRLLMIGLKMIQSGNYRLMPTEITRKAKMHERSFHSIFGTMEQYYQELIDAHEASIREQITRDIKENGKSLVRLMLLGK